MTRTNGQTTAMFVATLTVDGRDCGKWDGHAGGDINPNNSSRRIAGGQTIVLPGIKEISSIKLTRLHRIPLRADYDWIRARSGTGECVVTLREKDALGVATGAPFVHTGLVGEVPLLTYDETSAEGLDQEVNIDVDVPA